MNENINIIEELIKNANEGIQTSIATVVRVKGSSYKPEGAKMLIHENDHTTGLISGGCLEPDVIEVAKQVMESGKPVLKRYDLDENVVWGLGIGCPGTIDIYIEKINFRYLKIDRVLGNLPVTPFEAWLSCVKEEKMGVLATIVEETSCSQIEQRQIFVSNDHPMIGKLSNIELQHLVYDFSLRLLQESNPKSRTKTFTLSTGEKIDVFIDVNIPPNELIIFGAGHDAIPLADFGIKLGFKTTIVDPRPAFLTKNRFPGANMILADANSIPEKVKVNSRSCVVIMNHHLERDIHVLKHMLDANPFYIGILGPRSRGNKIFESLNISNAKKYGHIFNPIGLNIGSESPEEIAISILSEIIAFRNQCNGGFLREGEKVHQFE
ncbi:XdhC family protein [Bacillus smithii]|uniref:XdhC family protein n=1 Tax=Bacillus smithii TaxID=1479 RepID=UPI003D2533FC